MKNLLVLIVLCLLIPICGLTNDLSLQNQRRALNLFENVRCPTCVAQSIKDSQTIASRQLKIYIINRLAEGQTDDEILSQIRQYYGNDITFKPPISSYTVFLWVIPLTFLIFAIYKVIRR